jgi:hypothetical protein
MWPQLPNQKDYPLTPRLGTLGGICTGIQFQKLFILVDDFLDTIHLAPFKDFLDDPTYVISIRQLVFGDQ